MDRRMKTLHDLEQIGAELRDLGPELLRFSRKLKKYAKDGLSREELLFICKNSQEVQASSQALRTFFDIGDELRTRNTKELSSILGDFDRATEYGDRCSKIRLSIAKWLTEQ